MVPRPELAPSAGSSTGAWRDIENVSSSSRVAFIEGDEPRMLRAAALATQTGLCRPVLLGKRSEIQRASRDQGIDVGAIDTLDVSDPAVREQLVRDFERKVGPATDLRSATLSNPAAWGATLVRCGWMDAAIGGTRTTSADMLRAGLSCIGLAPERSTVSGAIFLDTQRPDVGSGGTLAFADAVVTPMPTVDQLADIAAATARSWRALMRTEPRIGFLSFSTRGSSGSPHVQRIRDAVTLFRRRFPEEAVDGELQFDAAVSTAVAERKHASGALAGAANVLVFPSLDSANIAYKVAEQLGGARARAFLQGLARPFADVSRGCSVDDIVTTLRMLLYDTLHSPEPESSRREGVLS
ncbi:phosphate acyltransferase [Nocardioides furvisabuli]|jgi:phosphate acetyltransferase|nr:phosphate acyltransferase [Nocardioides furvisabuli]